VNSEPQKETVPENQERSDQERSEREATFSRRGLLQWSVPAILAVSLPGQVSAGSNPHDDVHHDTHHDHVDTHQDDHQDGHQDMHEDSHHDSHGDSGSPHAGGKGQVPNFGGGVPQSGSGVVPKFSGSSAPAASPAPSPGGSGVVPRYNPPAK